MQARSFIRLLAASIMLLASSLATAQSSLLDSVPADTQEAISRVCLPVQFREGATAYRNCVQSELDLYRNGGTNVLGDLSFDDKYAVQQACAGAGADSTQQYQNCVSSQISELERIAEPELDKLSEDELYVVQQSCFSAQSEQGAAKYRECLNNEVDSLLAIPAVDTTGLDSLKKNALQLRCSSQASTAVQYRQCVAAEFESIAGRAPSFLPVSTATAIAPATRQTQNRSNDESSTTIAAANTQRESTPETPTENVEPKTITAAQVSKPTMALPRNIRPPSTADSQETQTALAESAESTPAASATIADSSTTQTNAIAVTELPETDSDAEASILAQNTVDDNATESAASDARVISKPNLVTAIDTAESDDAQQPAVQQTNIEPSADTAAPEPEATPSATAGLQESLATLWQSTMDKANTLSRTSWLVIAGLLALPALLLGLFSLSNRVERSRQAKHNTSSLAERIEPGLQTRRLRQEKEAAELFGDEPLSGADESIAEDFSESLQSRVDHDEPTRLAVKPSPPALDAAPASRQTGEHPDARVESAHAEADVAEQSSVTHTSTQNESMHLEWQSAFGSWLMQQPAEERFQSCIEFLVYWVAYGDERYHNDLRKRLFTATELSNHDQIKRWVLKQDVMAFSDVVGWMQREASLKQLDQTLALIMALLVTENGVTPVQNTMLRFLSDAFNLGIGRVEKRFERAFGHRLPPMPRPDKQAWWENQAASATELWDVKAMANKPEHEQMMARLGLEPDYDEAQVIQAFRRAARRCHPDRFTELGDRERAMAEQQFTKFEQARDKLLGVSV